MEGGLKMEFICDIAGACTRARRREKGLKSIASAGLEHRNLLCPLRNLKRTGSSAAFPLGLELVDGVDVDVAHVVETALVFLRHCGELRRRRLLRLR